MKLASFDIEGHRSWGVVEGHDVIDLGAVLAERYADLRSAIQARAYEEMRRAAARAPRHHLTAVIWLPPVWNPDKII